MKATTKLIVAGSIVLTGIAGVSALSIADGKEGYGNRSGHHEGYHGQHGSNQGMSGYGKHRGHHGKGRHMKRGMHLFENFDANGDDKVTQDEIDKVRQEKLSKYDSDKDGKLNLKEYEALWMEFMRERMVDRFQALDSDGDALVTSEEFEKRTANIVNYLDTNDDQVVSRDEIRKSHHRGHRRRGHGS